jgi:hypothetical protein
VRLGTGRGRRGVLVGVLTDGGDAGTRPESKEDGGDVGGRLGVPYGSVVPLVLRRREKAPRMRLDKVELLAVFHTAALFRWSSDDERRLPRCGLARWSPGDARLA